MTVRRRITSNNWIDARARLRERREMSKSIKFYATTTSDDGEAEDYF